MTSSNFNRKIKSIYAWAIILALTFVLGGCYFQKGSRTTPKHATSTIINEVLNETGTTSQGVVADENPNSLNSVVDTGDRSTGEYLDAIPNESLRWVGVRDGQTIAIDIYGNEEVLDRSIESIPMLPERDIYQTLAPSDYDFTAASPRNRFQVFVSPYDSSIGTVHDITFETAIYGWRILMVDLSKRLTTFYSLKVT